MTGFESSASEVFCGSGGHVSQILSSLVAWRRVPGSDDFVWAGDALDALSTVGLSALTKGWCPEAQGGYLMDSYMRN